MAKRQKVWNKKYVLHLFNLDLAWAEKFVKFNGKQGKFDVKDQISSNSKRKCDLHQTYNELISIMCVMCMRIAKYFS